MHIAIITRTFSNKIICGIGDHTRYFSNALRSQGHKVTVIAGRGEPENHLHLIEDNWNADSLSKLLQLLNSMDIDHLVLQYTFYAFSIRRGKQNFDLVDFWQTCNQRWQTSIILHETYFRPWWYPPSWVKGTIQKQALKLLVNSSNHIFTASQPVMDELKGWGFKDKVIHLPICSNFPLIQIDRAKIRQEQKIEPEEIVLTLFGSGNILLRWASYYVNHLDRFLCKHGIPINWLLLGGVQPEWFKLTAPVISFGRLTPDELSAKLQITDIFLVPHCCGGLSAKRGTVMAALQHGLPIVGTKGSMTDKFWTDVSGVTLVPMPLPQKFSEAVLKLSTDANLRNTQGKSNQDYYQKHFTAEKIASTFLKSIHCR